MTALLELVDELNAQISSASLDQREEDFRAALSAALDSLTDARRQGLQDAFSALLDQLRGTEHVHDAFRTASSGGGDDAFWDFCAWIVSRGSDAVTAAFAGPEQLRPILEDWDEGYYGEWMRFGPDTERD